MLKHFPNVTAFYQKMTEFKIPLGIKNLTISSQKIDFNGVIIITVQSTKSHTKCRKCGKPATKRYGHSDPVKIRHTSVFDTPVYLKIKPARYQCEHCKGSPTTTEKYDWCAKSGKITTSFEDYLMRCLINSTISDVSHKEHISYKTVETAVHNKIATQVNWKQYVDLQTIGIDEISNRKGHNKFITIVSVKDKFNQLSVIAVLPDRKKATVQGFFDSIPAHLKKTVKTVCSDMYDGFVYAAIETFGSQAVVIDRYHVAKCYRAPLDKLRVKEMKRLKNCLSEEEYRKLEGVMWILRKQHECLSQSDKDKLALLYHYSPLLKQAHRYALKLTQIFNSKLTRKLALAKINRWVKKVEKSNLTCFNTFIKTLHKYKACIVNYFKSRKTSGFVEGLNNKIKVINRRCYGLKKISSTFQRIQLDLQGFKMFVF